MKLKPIKNIDWLSRTTIYEFPYRLNEIFIQPQDGRKKLITICSFKSSSDFISSWQGYFESKNAPLFFDILSDDLNDMF